MDSLPDEILEMILQFAAFEPLSFVDIVRVRSVCRRWRNVLNVFRKVLWWSSEKGSPGGAWMFGQAIQDGDLEMVKVLRWCGFPWCELVCEYAAKFGELEILKWLRKNGCPWNRKITGLAAKNGHLEVLIWAKENGCPENLFLCDHGVAGAHPDVVKWLRENDYDLIRATARLVRWGWKPKE